MGSHSHIFYINAILAHVFNCLYLLNQLAQMFSMYGPEDGQQMTEIGSPIYQL